MHVTSIQNIYSITPLYTEQEVRRTLVDSKTHKETIEFIIYRVYNRLGQLEENRPQQIDLQA